jgi:hypothetical protein
MPVQVLRQCGDDLTRENIMRQAANLKDFRNPGLLPGSLINTSPTDYRVVKYMTLERFNGKSWEAAGRIGWRGHSCSASPSLARRQLRPDQLVVLAVGQVLEIVKLGVFVLRTTRFHISSLLDREDVK